MHPISSTHDYETFARSYAKRSVTSSDYLAFRELPAIATRLQIRGMVLDHGCGAGRSTRFLKSLGLAVVGADSEPAMLTEARRNDPNGDYRLVSHEALPFPHATFDLVFSSYVVLEQSTTQKLEKLIIEGCRVLKDGGHMIVVTNTAAFYGGQWVSCDVDFPENRPPLRPGQKVRVRLMPEEIELLDTFWDDADYKKAFDRAELKLVEEHRPLGRADDPIEWKDEMISAPYVVYVLRKEQH